jgi:hypothetical protein
MLLDGQVRMVIESNKGNPEALIRRLRDRGVNVETSYENLIQVVGTPEQLDSLDDSDIILIRQPYYSYGGPPSDGQTPISPLPPGSIEGSLGNPRSWKYSGGGFNPGIISSVAPVSGFTSLGPNKGVLPGSYISTGLLSSSKGEGKIDLEAFKTGGHPFNPQPGGAKFKPVPPGLGGTEFKPVPPGLGGAEFKPVPGPVGGVTIKFLEQSGN